MTTAPVIFAFLTTCVLSAQAAPREKRQASASPAPGSGVTPDPQLVQLLLQNQPQGQGQGQTQGVSQGQGQGVNRGFPLPGQNFGIPPPFFNMAQIQAAMNLFNSLYRMPQMLYPGKVLKPSFRFPGGGLVTSADGRDGMIRTPFGMASLDGTDIAYEFEI